jgi:arylsulfatase A-like enzyme
MKAILVMFDSLNRRMLPPYGCDWVHAPNFSRLARRSVTFDNAYVGSMPCMPARRELHTGRYNFLHASWGPVEPFDDSMPELLKQNGVYSHLISDHYHYWEDGGCTYHTRYASWENVRGQEGDPWKGVAGSLYIPDNLNNRPGLWGRQDWVNRQYIVEEEDFPQAVTFRLGLEFFRKNHAEDNWFLHLETFDPHEPYYVPQKYKDYYPHLYEGPVFDWPPYHPVQETPEQVEHLIYQNAALVSMCDAYLGKVLDLMDELNLWDDTLLIVNTDHGFLLGEHGWWAKCVVPFYNEVAHMPLFVWDPRCQKQDERRSSLVQTVDLAPTLLEFFGIPIPEDMQGKPLLQVVAKDEPVRNAGLFGLFGAHVNVTDGRYVYMRGCASPDNQPLYEYTLMPTQHGDGRAFIPLEHLRELELSAPFPFSKGTPLLKIPSHGFHGMNPYPFGTLLFDLQNDPKQEHPLHDEAVEADMIQHLVRLMLESDAPEEQFTRLGLKRN